MREYRPLYSDAVVETMLRWSKRRQQKLLIANNPFIKPDYVIKDSDGRDIGRILVEGFVIAYSVDHPVCKVMIVEVDNVR